MKKTLKIFFSSIFMLSSLLGRTQSNYTNLNNYMDSVLHIVDNGSNEQKVLAYCDLMYMISYHDVKQSIEYGQEAVALANKMDVDTLQIYVHTTCSQVYSEWGQNIEALEHAQIALEIQTEIGDDEMYVVINNMGDIYMDLNDYEEAYKAFQQSLKLSKENGDQYLETIAMFNIGRVYKVQANYPMALEYIYKSKRLSAELEDLVGIAYCNHELGLISYLKKDMEKAIEYLSMAIELSDSLRESHLSAQSMVKIADVYRDQENYLKSLENYHRALKESERIKDNRGIAEAYLGLGSLMLEMNSIESASESLHKGLGYAQTIRNKVLESKYYQQLSSFYEMRQNEKEALVYFKKFKSLSDSVFNRDINMQIALIETQYESEKKDKEIAQLSESQTLQGSRIQKQNAQTTILLFGLAVLFVMVIVAVLIGMNKLKANDMLRQQKKEIIAKNKELGKLNKVKDKFFSIVSHDLKSPFQSLSGILELMSHDALSNDEVKKLFKELKLKFDSTNYLLENLLEWARLQMKETKFDPNQIPLQTTIDEELNVIKNSNTKDVGLKNNVESVSLAYADMNMFKLVIRNLVVNAVKFTQNKGNVEIVSEEMGDFICISVKDNGVGISKENQEKLFNEDSNISTLGTALEFGTGLGLNLCKEFVEIHGGKIWVESEEGKGSTFKFTLKKAS
jgi:signal transduction histidine kinase/Tfp pilus assembly protein PilF